VREAEGKQHQAQQRRGGDVGEEVPVIPPSDTIVQPDAMMILRLDARIADSAVMCARRAPDVAAFAVFGRDLHGLVSAARAISVLHGADTTRY
jgi:hypothetical protein